MSYALRLIAICVFSACAGVAMAATDRVALVLGLGAYQSIEPLDNTRNDARPLPKRWKVSGLT